MDGKPVALITYDQPYPEPLHAVRPLDVSFGMALVLTPQATDRTFAALDVSYVPEKAADTGMTNDALERIRLNVPAARCLPLLAALGRKATGLVIIAYGDRHLRVDVSPSP